MQRLSDPIRTTHRFSARCHQRFDRHTLSLSTHPTHDMWPNDTSVPLTNGRRHVSSSSIHRLLNPPAPQPTNFSIHRLLNPPASQPTNSSTHQLSNPPTPQPPTPNPPALQPNNFSIHQHSGPGESRRARCEWEGTSPVRWFSCNISRCQEVAAEVFLSGTATACGESRKRGRSLDVAECSYSEGIVFRVEGGAFSCV
jgi:hypothetical protein